MRVNHGDGGRRGDHRLYRAAAFAQTASALWLARWWGATAMPCVETLLCMKRPRNPESHKVLQKLFQF
jgi:hypothetical protein